MEYWRLSWITVSSEADRTNIQAYLAKGEMHSTTIRIPDTLKDAVSEEAALSGISFSSYVRMALIKDLTDKAEESR